MSLSRTSDSSTNETLTPEDLIQLLDQIFDQIDKSDIIIPLLEFIALYDTPLKLQELLNDEDNFTCGPYLRSISNAIKNDDLWRTLAVYVIKKNIEYFSIPTGTLNHIDLRSFLRDEDNPPLSQLLPYALTKTQNGEDTTNLSGELSYPVDVSAKRRGSLLLTLENSEELFLNLLASLKIINPHQLNLSNIWLPIHLTSVDDITPKIIMTAKPEQLCLRNTAILTPNNRAGRKAVINTLIHAISAANVKYLDISWCLLLNGSGELFEALTKTQVTQLNLSFNFMDHNTREDWIKLKELVAHNQISHLDLSGNFFYEIFENNESFDAFLEVIRQPSLYYVNLSQNGLHKLSKKNMAALIEALEQSSIRRLEIITPIPTTPECNIKHHKITITKGYTDTEIAFAVEPHEFKPGRHRSREQYTVIENQLPDEVHKKILGSISKRHSLNELAALSLSQQPKAIIYRGEKNLFFFKSKNVAEKAITPELAALINEFKYM